MYKKIIALLVSLMLLLLVISSVAMSEEIEIKNSASSLSTKTVYVDDDNTEGPWDGTLEYPYQYISDGIFNSTEGDNIYVFNGTYYENITVDKPITLIGENKSSTIIDGMYADVVVEITYDYVNIINFTIKNSGGYMHNAGVKIYSENNSITGCIIYRTKTGIYLDNSYNNEINNCVLHTNGEGIFLKESQNNIISNCYITHNAIGIHLRKSKWLEISNSYVHTCGLGLLFNYSSNIEILHSAISDNNDNQGGTNIIKSSYVNITNSNIVHSGVGINIVNSSNIWITKCDVYWNTHVGIDIESNAENVNILNCDIAYNFRQAIRITNSYCKINSNNFHENAVLGLHFKSSFCDARKNWWGFIFGPALSQFGIADRVTKKLGSVFYFPWRLRKLQNAGSDWETNEFFKNVEIPDDVHKTIEFSEADTDGDGCPDWWEEKWGYDPDIFDDHANLDPDEDALNNIEECFTDQWNSSPSYKDIFIELDWVDPQNPDVSTKPSADLMEELKSVFAKEDINLHVDYGGLGGGEEIPHIPSFSGKYRKNYAAPKDMYWNYFLHNDLDNPRKGIFHYGLISEYGPSGGNSFIGWDHLDSFVSSIQTPSRGGPYTNKWAVTVKVLHEAGHTLGLFVDDHAGIDNFASTFPDYKEFWLLGNYKSCMSYRYTWEVLDYSDGGHGFGDFDDWENLDLSFFKNSHFEWPKE